MQDAKLPEKVVETVLDRGKLSKSEVLLLFGCPPDDYEHLKKDILRRWGNKVESGPRKIGGFVAKYRRRGRPKTATLPPAELELSEWERASIQRLAAVLDHVSLEDLLATCDSGRVFELEFFTGSGTASGFGIGKDNENNIYRFVF